MMNASEFRAACGIVAILSCRLVYAQSDSVFEQTCLQSFPEPIQAKLEQREKYLSVLLEPQLPDLTPYSVITKLKTWNPGSTITVAFRGGSYELREQIAQAALPWETHGNLKLDFGQDAAARTFREWTDEDASFVAHIRIGFDQKGYWSLVGSDSIASTIVAPGQASMNLARLDQQLPNRWQSVVLHEFGHALGFQHEHQHPSGGCDTEFHWEDEPDYVPTTDMHGQFVPDEQGRRPGIYTVLGGPPNNWSRQRVDFNLRQLTNQHAYDVTSFDRDSIMKYYFPAWMFVDANASHCYTGVPNVVLSPGDIQGLQRAYPRTLADVHSVLESYENLLEKVLSSQRLVASERDRFENQLRSVQER